MSLESKGDGDHISCEGLSIIFSVVLEVIDRDEKDIDIIFITDERMAELNKEYRDKEGTTDVLTFPYDDAEVSDEVYISFDRITKQAEEYKVSVAEELTKMIVHGILHSYGYDHTEKNDRIVMETKENNILKKLM